MDYSNENCVPENCFILEHGAFKKAQIRRLQSQNGSLGSKVCIIDLAELDSAPESKDIHCLVSCLNKCHFNWTVFIAPEAAQFGMIRMLQALADGQRDKPHIAVFHNIKEVEEWLKTLAIQIG